MSHERKEDIERQNSRRQEEEYIELVVEYQIPECFISVIG